MSEKQYLFAPPESLTDDDIIKLEAHGVIVIFSEKWRDMRIITAEPLLPSTEMLSLAASAVVQSDMVCLEFGKSLARRLAKRPSGASNG